MAGDNERYLNWVRSLDCCACARIGPGEAHHKTGAGKGIRAHDTESMPLCSRCHNDFHNLAGRFKGWDKERIREWQNAMIKKTRQRSYLSDDDAF